MEHIDIRRFIALRDSLQNMSEAFGRAVLPVFQEMTNALNNLVLPLVSAGWDIGTLNDQMRTQTRRLKAKAQSKGHRDPSVFIMRGDCSDTYVIFIPVATCNQTILDEEGVPVDYVAKGEPYTDPYGGVLTASEFHMNYDWTTILTPTKCITGKKTEAVLAEMDTANWTAWWTPALLGTTWPYRTRRG